MFSGLSLQVLVEQSLIGWKEFELEVMRDLADNVVIICSIENVDPMGVHTGDSITIAPAQTLTDREYQRLRDAAVAIIREMGVECGGSNVQMAVDPKDGQVRRRSNCLSSAQLPPAICYNWMRAWIWSIPCMTTSCHCWLLLRNAPKGARGCACHLCSAVA